MGSRLYMPKLWFDKDHEKLWKSNLIPENLSFQTKNQIASDLMKSVIKTFPARWVGCDAGFGTCFMSCWRSTFFFDSDKS